MGVNPNRVQQRHLSVPIFLGSSMTKATTRRVTPKEWAKAEAMYESGDYTLEQISEELGVHLITVQRHMSKEGIEKGARADEIKRRAAEKMDAAVDEDAEVLRQRIKETKEEHYRLNKVVDGRVRREMVMSEQEGRQPSLNVIKTLKLMADTLKVTRENRYAILGIDNDHSADDELPTLEVREMWEEEVEAIRNRQDEQAKEMGLEVTDESEPS